MQSNYQTRMNTSNPFVRLGFTLIGGFILFILTVVFITGSYQIWYAERIFPGISIAGVDLSGTTIQEATQQLSQVMTYPHRGQIIFTNGGKIWIATPASLGLVFDPGASAKAAYKVGRSGGLFGSLQGQVHALQRQVSLSAMAIFDQRIAYNYLQDIARQIDQPAIDAELSIDGITVMTRSSQVGLSLNVDKTMIYLVNQLQSLQDGEVPLVIDEQNPEILDISTAESQVNAILSGELILVFPDPNEESLGPWSVDVQTLASLISPTRTVIDNVSQYIINFDEERLKVILEEIADQIERDPENTRFIFNDGTGQLDILHSAVTGRILDFETSIETIQHQLLAGEHTIPLEIDYLEPEIGDQATSQSLGITELISEERTYFYGSSAERIQNIQAAATRFHGLLVPPESTFSMADALGDISLDNGYAEALIIYGGKTIQGVGGGVCQVSTTLFRTAFFAGFPILERHAHAYRVGYYEQTQYGRDQNLAGLDATVYAPLVDLKFNNDSPYWLLMEVYINEEANRITWKFYSTSDGRSVVWNTSGLKNVVSAPEPQYIENEELAAGEMRQIDYGADGADVTITRTVLRAGEILHQDQFNTHYQVWQAICEYGPGTNNPVSLASSLGICKH